jgi:hypothetical protein
MLPKDNVLLKRTVGLILTLMQGEQIMMQIMLIVIKIMMKAASITIIKAIPQRRHQSLEKRKLKNVISFQKVK